jgi:hypothetical protein
MIKDTGHLKVNIFNSHYIPTYSYGTYRINPLKPTYIIFKDSVCASKKTQCISITMLRWLTLFGVIINIHAQNHIKPTNIL